MLLTAAKDIKVTAAGAPESLYGPSPNVGAPSDPNRFTVGNQFTVSANGLISAIRLWRFGGSATSRYVAIWRLNTAGSAWDKVWEGTTSEPGTGWTLTPVVPALAAQAGQVLRVAYGYDGQIPGNSFAYSSDFPPGGPHLTWQGGVYSDATMAVGGDRNFPSNLITPNNYFGDVVFSITGVVSAKAVYAKGKKVWPLAYPSTLLGCVLALESESVLSGPVTTWLDQSSQANHLGLMAAGTPVAANGYVTLTTVASMQTSNPVNVPGTTPRHLFAVVRSRNVDGSFMGYGTLGESNLFDLWNYVGQGTLIWHGYGGPNDTVSGAPAFTPNVWHLIEVSYDGVALRVHVDQIAPAVRNLTLATAASKFQFGQGRYSPAGDFDMRAFYFYDRYLSGSERQQVVDYLRGKWGLP